MIAEINGVLSSVRALTDLVKANKSLANFNELGSAVTEVTAKLLSAQGAVLAAQEKQSTLTERIRALEKEIAELKDWNQEAERYQLTEISTGLFVYAVKPGMERGDPMHHLCTNCYAQREKSILQLQKSISKKWYECYRCKSELHLGSRTVAPILTT